MAEESSSFDIAEGGKQRWYVAVLFVDLCHSTRLAVDLDPEIYSEVLDTLNDLYRRTIDQHGGSVVQVYGDGAVAMFGFPAAEEEDVRLALNAALALRAQAADLRFDFPELAEPLRVHLHMGVHAGAALIRKGDTLSGTYRLHGDVMNIASKLSDAAEADEILVSTSALGATAPFFNLGASRTVQVSPQHASKARLVGERSALATRYQARRKRSRLPFLGRQLELQALAALADRVSRQQASVALVVGPPGVGKTRLVDEFLTNSPGWKVLHGYCETTTAARPWQAWITTLRALLEADGVDAQTRSRYRRVYDTLRQGGPDAGEPDILVGAFLEEMLQVGPVVIFFDDWQWVDDSSRQLLEDLLKQAKGALLVILTTRRQTASDQRLLAEIERIDLDELSSAELEVAIEHLLPQLDARSRDRVKELCGGNPLYLEELSLLPSLDRLDLAPSTIEFVPQWLYTMVQARVVQLSEAEREVVQVAAVVGDTVPFWLLQVVGGASDVERMTGLVLADLMFPSADPGVWKFKHGLTREIVYDLIGLRKKQSMHLQIAEAISKQGDEHGENLIALSGHYFAANQFAQAEHYASLAGDQAARIPALDIARTQYQIALKSLFRDNEREDRYEQIFALARRLTRVSVLDPVVEVVEYLERVLAFADERDDARGVAYANYWLGAAQYGLGNPRLALILYYRARTYAQRAGLERLSGEIRRTLAQASVANCEYKSATGLLDLALDDAHTGSKSEWVAICYTYSCRGMMLADQGRFDDAQTAFDRALEHTATGLLPSSVNMMTKQMLSLILQGRWQEANDLHQLVQEDSERISNLYILASGLMLRAYTRWHDHRQRVRAFNDMLRSTELLESAGTNQFISLNYGWLAEMYLARGDHKNLRRAAAKAIRRARIGDRFGECPAYRSLALATLYNEWRPAEEYLALARDSAALRDSPREQALNDICEARIATAAGQDANAQLLEERALAQFTELGMHWHRENIRSLLTW
ncbi:MAG: AAA family ATPase [Pseudomonadota bacterium]